MSFDSASRIVSILSKKGIFRSGASNTLRHKISKANTLNKDRTRFTKLFNIVLLCLLSIVVRIVPITAPRHAESELLEEFNVETDVVRTSASQRMTAFAEFCHCVHTKCF